MENSSTSPKAEALVARLMEALGAADTAQGTVVDVEEMIELFMTLSAEGVRQFRLTTIIEEQPDETSS